MADSDVREFAKAVAKIIAAAWTDPSFLTRLTDPTKDQAQILRDKQLILPPVPDNEDAQVVFVANTNEKRYIVIPQAPAIDDDDVSLFVKLRQLETICTKCRSSVTGDLIQDIKQVFGLSGNE